MDIFQDMKRDKEIILGCDTIEQYKTSSLTRIPEIYSDYARFERCFWTIKEHPHIDLNKEVFYPELHKASELFSDFFIAHHGVGNANQAQIPAGYLFMWDHDEGPVGEILDAAPKLKTFKQMYVKPVRSHATYDECGGWFVGVRTYNLYGRNNTITGKKEWLITGTDKTGFHEHWLAVINEWDLKSSVT